MSASVITLLLGTLYLASALATVATISALAPADLAARAPMWGVAAPSGLLALCALSLGLGGWLFLRVGRVARVATAVTLLALFGAAWARSLVAHSLSLSAPLAVGVILAAVALSAAVSGPERRRPRAARVGATSGLGPAAAVVGVLVGAGALGLGVLSYGAIWGETRCGQSGRVDCLVAQGPRVRVPVWLARFGVEVFLHAPGADLGGRNLAARDLRYAELPGANLHAADLSGTHLRRARLRAANLSAARLRDVWAQGADLREANLQGADLRGIMAYGIDLRGADLRAVNGVDASLSHAYVTGARFDGADLRGAYLRFTEGLTQAQLDTACGDHRTRLPPGYAIPPCAETPASGP